MLGSMQYIYRLFLNFGLILGLAMLGLGHVPSGKYAGPDFTAYTMPDGQLPQLCSTDANGGETHPLHKVHCPACHLFTQLPAQNVAIVAIWTLNPFAALHSDNHQVHGQIGAAHLPEARAPPTQAV
jgi:hypothetical protein